MNMPYHLLLGRRDWQPLIDDGGEDVIWDPENHQLSLTPELIRFPRRQIERIYTADDRRGAASDLFGHLYWIDSDEKAICYRPAGSSKKGVLWTVDDLGKDCGVHRSSDFKPVVDEKRPVPRLRGLTVTKRSYLVVGTLEPSGLLVFDLHHSAPPRWHRWPDAMAFEPFDMTAAPDGGLWILDLPSAQNARLWYLDCALRIGSPHGALRTELASAQVEEFHGIGGVARIKPAQSYPSEIDITLSVPLSEVSPVAIESLPDGTLLLLDQGPFADTARIHRLKCGVAQGEVVDLFEESRNIYPNQERFTGHDLAFLGNVDTNNVHNAFSGMLYVAAAEGNQSFGFSLSISGVLMRVEVTTQYLPMRRYAGKALISGSSDVFYDQQDIWLALTELPRPRYARHGRVSIAGPVFELDGKQPQCQWHRLFIDGCIPPGDAITVESRAADEREDLQRAPWRQEQALYLRLINRHDIPTDKLDSMRIVDEGERPFHRPFSSKSLLHKGVGTWELLFQQTIGRYLELRVTLIGSGRSSPKIRALRVYYPRLSYPQRFLPAVYSEEPVSASFLERFLANFEGFYTELEGRIASVQTLFDSRTAPVEALDWLAGWLGAVLADDWEEARRRLFIRHAVELYRQRGTVQGLVKAIRLATEPCPDERLFDSTLDYAPFGVRIVEHFASRVLPSGLPVSSSTTLLPSQISSSAAWQASQGGARLHRLWREFLYERYAPSDDSNTLLKALQKAWSKPPTSIAGILFSPLTPTDATHASDRNAFIDDRLGLPYAELDVDDAELYRSYLVRKYGSITELNSAYGLVGALAHASFDVIDMSENRLPSDGAALNDWFQFATVDVPAARAAHRFSVLIPVKPSQGLSEQRRLLERVRAIVERERPSHAIFDVQPYWALFRVGTARTGLDTVLGEGSRFTSLVLDAGYIGEGLLAENHPWNITDRFVGGRDGVGAGVIG